MPKKPVTADRLARETYPSYILFEEQGGFYWLRAKDLARARTILPIKSAADSVGFDKATMSAFASKLNKKGIKVGILKGNAVRTIECHRSQKLFPAPSTSIWLAPQVLVGGQELERLQSCVKRKRSTLTAIVESITMGLSNGHHQTWNTDFGTLVVYQVSEDIYEVDWELTTVSKTTFEALALATHLAGEMLPCRLVLPKSKRKKNGNTPKQMVSVGEPVTYGQLRLPI